jgi:hypothetical protein
MTYDPKSGMVEFKGQHQKYPAKGDQNLQQQVKRLPLTLLAMVNNLTL